MQEIFDRIRKIGIIPVVRIDEEDSSVPLARALLAGGLPCAEITFRTDAARGAIERISAEVPEMLIGAGTVLSVEQVDLAIAGGAKFIVTPGYNPKVVAHCKERGIPIIPGCTNPSDMDVAIEAGLDTVKFFPAEESGGLRYLKAVSAPYPMLKFIPTGGIGPDNLNSYLSFDRIIACGGSWMVKAHLINDGRFDEITLLTRQAVNKMLGFRLAHLGINTANEDDANSAAKIWQSLFSFNVIPTPVAVFSDSFIEHMKSPGPGKNGHIAIGTYSVERAIAYLERRGCKFRSDTIKKDDLGNIRLIYLEEEVADFAVHLVEVKWEEASAR